jgi:hypothetical protein
LPKPFDNRARPYVSCGPSRPSRHVCDFVAIGSQRTLAGTDAE